MTIESALDQNALSTVAPKKFSSKTYYASVFIAFLFGVVLTLTYRPDFGNLTYEVTESDFRLAQTKCLGNIGFKSLLVNSSRSGYRLSALCEDGSSFSW